MQLLDDAQPSSTVVVARSAPAAPEIFMVRRHENSSFGAAFAFPGGVVDADDYELDDCCGDFDDAIASARLGIESGGLAYYVAAVRELFEETGVLLADASLSGKNLREIRDDLNAGSVSWNDIVRGNALQLSCRELHYVAHWVTPPQRPRRYSTRFFVAALPDSQSAVHCGKELTDSRWVTAHDMLLASRSGDAKLHFPTIKTLESLARHKTLDSLVDWAASRVEWGVTSMIPVLIERQGKETVVLPGDRDYPGTRT